MAGELTGIAKESCSLKSRRVPSTIIIKISIVLSTIFAAHNTPKTETRTGDPSGTVRNWPISYWPLRPPAADSRHQAGPSQLPT